MEKEKKEEDNYNYQIGHLSSLPILSKSPIAMSQTQTLAKTTQLVWGTKVGFTFNHRFEILKARASHAPISFLPLCLKFKPSSTLQYLYLNNEYVIKLVIYLLLGYWLHLTSFFLYSA